MSRQDYAHWNEDADYMWWHEEGKHPSEPEYDPDDFLPNPEMEIRFCDECETELDDNEKCPNRCPVCGRHEYVDQDGNATGLCPNCDRPNRPL